MLVRHASVLFLAGLAAIAAIASCAQEEYPASVWYAQHESSSADAGADSARVAGPAVCTQAHANALTQRLEAMTASSGSTASTGTVVLVSDLFDQFTAVCGSCHGPAVNPPGFGGFQITTATAFPQAMSAAVLAHVTSNVPCPYTPDPTNLQDPMPPCSSGFGMPYDQRPPTDPVRVFAELVQAWLAAGSPPSFTPPSSGGTGEDGGADAGADAGATTLSLTPAVGTTLTDVGNCIPSASLVATEKQRSAALDTMFAGLTVATSGAAQQQIGLPEHLGETDLFTLDSAVLAQYGVVAYAPGYPLWSDNAGKLRYVRVPRGTSIQFDKATQSFKIPPNTRFYKTFMKPDRRHRRQLCASGRWRRASSSRAPTRTTPTARRPRRPSSGPTSGTRTSRTPSSSRRR